MALKSRYRAYVYYGRKTCYKYMSNRVHFSFRAQSWTRKSRICPVYFRFLLTRVSSLLITLNEEILWEGMQKVYLDTMTQISWIKSQILRSQFSNFAKSIPIYTIIIMNICFAYCLSIVISSSPILLHFIVTKWCGKAYKLARVASSSRNEQASEGEKLPGIDIRAERPLTNTSILVSTKLTLSIADVAILEKKYFRCTFLLFLNLKWGMSLRYM